MSPVRGPSSVGGVGWRCWSWSFLDAQEKVVIDGSEGGTEPTILTLQQQNDMGREDREVVGES